MSPAIFFFALFAAFLCVAWFLALLVIGLRRLLRATAFLLLLIGSVALAIGALAEFAVPATQGAHRVALTSAAFGAAFVTAAVVLDRVVGKGFGAQPAPKGFEVMATDPRGEAPTP